jgi:hypothetical protein
LLIADKLLQNLTFAFFVEDFLPVKNFLIDADLRTSKVFHKSWLRCSKRPFGHLYFSQPKEGEKHEMGIAAH